MTVSRDMLVSELQNLLRLTASEQTIATVRRAQARTTALEEELAANVDKARERARLLATAITQAGGVPDVVGTAVGKLGAFATTQLNQVQTLQGALLGDLALEHQLRERTRYARTLAQSLGETSVLPVLDRLETAHTATIDWLEERLSEVGRTGTSLLRATPLQAAVGAVRSAALVPLGAVAGTVNRASALLWKRTPAQVKDAAEGAVEAVDTAVDTAVDRAAAGARTVVQRASDAAEQAGSAVEDRAVAAAASTADAVQGAVQGAVQTVEQTVEQAVEGTEQTVAEVAEEAKEHAAELDVVDLTGTGEVAHPFAGYERLSGDRVMGHVRQSEDVAELEQVLAFETANKARKGVLAAVQERLEELSSRV